MGREPQLSTVICTINRPELIGAAVESVLANDHPSFELLVVDQSRDAETETVLEKFRGDQCFRYVRIERVGLSAAYNAGIEMTRAPLLAFTDDDCVAPTYWLSSVAAAFHRNPDVELLYGQTLIPPELKDTPGVVPSVFIPQERKLGRGHGFMVGGMGDSHRCNAQPSWTVPVPRPQTHRSRLVAHMGASHGPIGTGRVQEALIKVW